MGFWDLQMIVFYTAPNISENGFVNENKEKNNGYLYRTQEPTPM